MRHYINIISALILAALAGNSCVKESVAAIGGEGEPVELTLDVTSRALDKVIVKSWDPNDEDEAKVNDLRVYIFSESGTLVGYKYFGKADLNFSADLDSDNGYNSSATLTGIKTKTGTAYIYAIANAITSQYQVTETDAKEITNIDETDLSSSNLTRENFLAATYSRQAGSYDPRDNTFLMSGYVNNGKPVTIRRKTGGTGVAEIVSPTEDKDKRLKLFKVFSKNKLTIETGNDAAGNPISFDPDYMEIHNVPKTVALLPDGTTDASDFETFERVVLDEKYLNFYLPENLQSKNKKNTISVWNDREKNTYSAAGDKSFVNAPDNATYLVVHGRYRAGDHVGNVAYTIHLGDFGNNGSPDPLDNFDVCRNFSYQYTLKINGVNNFIAEAKKEGDGTIAKDDPGSEGIVIKTTAAGMLHADCHYEARVMKFNKAEVKGLIDNNFGYILKIHTIFGESKCLIVAADSVYEATQYYLDKSSGKVPTPLTKINTDGTLANPSRLLVGGAGEADFNWVHFVKNTGAAPSSPPSDSPGCRITSNHTKQNVCAYPGTDKTMNVFQFLRKLYVAASTDNANDGFFDSDGNVYVTCFIDENYYANREWTKYANQTDSRRLYFANDFQLSKDGKSSYAEAKYVIEQNSIWTFYRLDSNLKPYGVETISEEEEIENFIVNYSGYSSSYKDDWKGYTVASNYYKANSLYTPRGAIKIRSASTSEPAKQDLYTDAYRACMSRNRDENGNGNIDADEVKWYLATVDQYKGLWIGESVLPTDTKLFQPVESNWKKLNEKYVTSSNDGLKLWHFFTASTQAVFWPEEGASTSPWGENWSKASKVRCVRTLESNRDGRKDPDVFYDAPVKNADGSYDITLRVNKGAGRDFQSGPVPCTLERGEATQNNVSRKFRVDSGNLAGTFKRAQITSSISSPDVLVKEDADVCWNKKNGSADEPWRVPNQKELLVMSVVASNNDNTFNLDHITNFLWSNTYFTGLVKNYKLFNNESQLTEMYKSSPMSETEGIGLVMLKDSYQFTINPGTSEGNVRCVMDVKE